MAHPRNLIDRLLITSVIAGVTLSACAGPTKTSVKETPTPTLTTTATAALLRGIKTPTPEPTKQAQKDYEATLNFLNSAQFVTAAYGNLKTNPEDITTRMKNYLSAIDKLSEKEKFYYITVEPTKKYPITILLPPLNDYGVENVSIGKKSDPAIKVSGLRLIPKPLPTEIDKNAVEAFMSSFKPALDEYNAHNPQYAGNILPRTKVALLFILPFGNRYPVIAHDHAFEYEKSGETKPAVIVTNANETSIFSEDIAIGQANHLFTSFSPKEPNRIEYHMLTAGPFIEMAQILTAVYSENPQIKQASENRNNSLGFFFYYLSKKVPYDKYSANVDEKNNLKDTIKVPEKITTYKFSREFYEKMQGAGINPMIKLTNSPPR